MQIIIHNVLDTYQIEALTSLLEASHLYEDGRNTAGNTAKSVKNNWQAKQGSLEIKGAQKTIELALRKHPLLVAAAIPLNFTNALMSCYTENMQYGSHIDNPFIDNVRTDLSYTLFLSKPENYEGGELVLQKPSGDEYIKLPQGSLILYASTHLHRVAEVTSGKRLAAVGWIQSRIKSPEAREILFDLSKCLAELNNTPEHHKTRLSLQKIKANLTRMWDET
ncbi:Fe2+-dependent dioxygenase [Teredinibacter purpureus]|jgi:Uncharacterized iron-regulated protein|uniref:Fe2+-dependent dioxygenase n=1 Tax=Teredinibacter purpureus TaxID=2731756 RepID=UPI0005F82E54|nr:Fe2+-dependent dioxygenase [Teredinibacter purpureus]